jgi:hypothetical protein
MEIINVIGLHTFTDTYTVLYIQKLFDASLLKKSKIKVYACLYEITCQFENPTAAFLTLKIHRGSPL